MYEVLAVQWSTRVPPELFGMTRHNVAFLNINKALFIQYLLNQTTLFFL